MIQIDFFNFRYFHVRPRPAGIIDGAGGVTVNSATDELDAAETAARHQDGYSPGKQRGKMHGEVGGV
jgi:hypothetical protein